MVLQSSSLKVLARRFLEVDDENDGLEETTASSSHEDELSETMRTAFIVTSVVCGLISCLSSLVVIAESVSDLRRPNGTAGGSSNHRFRNHRASKPPRAVPYMFLALSAAMALWALTWATGPWLGANEAACTIQAFVKVYALGVASIVNATVIAFYVFMIRYSWTEERLYKTMIVVNASAWIGMLGLSVPPAIHGIYGFNGRTCFVFTPSEESCTTVDDGQEEEEDCSRQELTERWLAISAFAPHVFCLVAVIVMFFMIYCFVRKQENRIHKRYVKSTMNYLSRHFTGPKQKNRDKPGDSTNTQNTDPCRTNEMMLLGRDEQSKPCKELQQEVVSHEIVFEAASGTEQMDEDGLEQVEEQKLEEVFYDEEHAPSNATTTMTRPNPRQPDEPPILPPRIHHNNNSVMTDEEDPKQQPQVQKIQPASDEQAPTPPPPTADKNTNTDNNNNNNSSNTIRPWDGYSIDRTKSQAVAHQGIFHCALFLGVAASEVLALVSNYQVALWYISQLVKGLQGFWLLAIFCRPRIEMKTTPGRVIRRLLVGIRLLPQQKQQQQQQSR